MSALFAPQRPMPMDLGLSEPQKEGRPMGEEPNDIENGDPTSRLEKIEEMRRLSLLEKSRLPILLRRLK
jgi:hypothetical protein